MREWLAPSVLVVRIWHIERGVFFKSERMFRPPDDSVVRWASFVTDSLAGTPFPKRHISEGESRIEVHASFLRYQTRIDGVDTCEEYGPAIGQK